MDKSNKENISNGKAEKLDALQPKDSTKVNALCSHGMKLSANMTSHDKKEFLSKFEEWRKARREKFVLPKKTTTKQNQMVQSKVSISSFPLSNKSNGVYVIHKKGGKDESLEKTDRLYKNAGTVRNPNIKSSRVENEILKPIALNVSKTNKPLGVPDNIKLNSSYESNKIHIPDETYNCLPSTTKTEIRNVKIQHQSNMKEMVGTDESKDVLHLTLLDGLTNNKVIQKVFEEGSSENQNEMEKNKEKFINFEKLSNETVKDEIPSHSDSLEINYEINKKCDEPNKTQGLDSKTNGEGNSQFDVELTSQNLNFIPVTKKAGSEKGKTNLAFKTNILDDNKGSMIKIRETDKDQVLLRRSISMIYRKKCKMSSDTRQRSLSEKSLLEMKSSYHYTANDANIQCVSRPANSIYLRQQLEDWLKVNGHYLEGYPHLGCFDVTNAGEVLLQQTATKPEVLNSSKSSYCNNTFSKTPDYEVRKDDSAVEDLLKELHRLIVDLKYPSDRCEEWLCAIKNKYDMCSKSYLFWECLAALDESKSNKESAVECYKENVVKDPEVDLVADSLTELFDKMIIDQQKSSKTKIERGLDLGNIFKSTVIKFAIQRKNQKESDSKLGQDVQQHLYVATPVRRSSRIKTPSKSQVVSSLRLVTPGVRKNMEFRPNDLLLGE